MTFTGSDYAAIAVIMIMILGPMAAGAKVGINEGVTRDTPVTVSAPAVAPTTTAPATAAPAPAPAAPAPQK